MIYLIVILLGLAAGSFVNALVWRLHQQLSGGKKSARARRELSIVNGRSVCPECHHQPTWYDLVPVLSWLSLSGKCRYCHEPISRQYPLVELLTAGLFALSYAAWPYDLSGSGWLLLAIWLITLTALVALAVYDLRWMLLPNRIVYPVIGLSLVYVVVLALIEGKQSVVPNALAGLLTLGGLFYILFQVSKGRWIGGGDVKLGFGLGLLAGSALSSFLLLFLASEIGTVVALVLIARSRASLGSRMPFGPFLIAAAVIVLLFGRNITEWWNELLLI